MQTVIRSETPRNVMLILLGSLQLWNSKLLLQVIKGHLYLRWMISFLLLLLLFILQLIYMNMHTLGQGPITD